MSGMSSDWVVWWQGRMWQDLYTRGTVAIDQPRNIVFEHVQKTCKQLRAEVYEIDNKNYLLHARARTTWKTFGHKFGISLGKHDHGTIVELYYNFVGTRGGPYKDFVEKFFKIFIKESDIKSRIKYDVVDLRLGNLEKKPTQESVVSKLCTMCKTKISLVLISILIFASLTSAYAVTFTDHTGYIPDWARSIGDSQASAICTSSSIAYGTVDSDWCGEFLGYRVDQFSGQSNTSVNPSNNLQVTIQYHKENLSSIPLDLGISNPFQDAKKRFLIDIPASWIPFPAGNSDMSDDTISHVGSFETGNKPDLAFLDIERSEGLFTNDVQWDSSWTDKKLQEWATIDSFIKNPTEINIDHYSDVVKISMIGTELTFSGEIEYEKLTLFLIKNTTVEYEIRYSAFAQDIYDRYASEADKMVDSMHIYEIPRIVPEFGSLAGMMIAASIGGSLVIFRRFSKL